MCVSLKNMRGFNIIQVLYRIKITRQKVLFGPPLPEAGVSLIVLCCGFSSVTVDLILEYVSCTVQ